MEAHITAKQVVQSLLQRDVGADDGRLERLSSLTLQLLQNDDEREEIAVLLWSGALLRDAQDFRIVAICTRLLGHCCVGQDVKRLRDHARSLVFHAEPLVRHAALYCCRQAKVGIPLSPTEWQQLLMDDSIYVQREARLSFAMQLDSNDEACHSALKSLMQPPLATQEARALVELAVIVPASLGVAEWLVEQGLTGGVVDLKASFHALGQVWTNSVDRVDWNVTRRWLASLNMQGRYNEAVYLCGCIGKSGAAESVVVEVLPQLTSCASQTAVLLMHKARGRSDEGVRFCLSILRNKNALDKYIFAACEAMANWREPVSVEAAELVLNRAVSGGASAGRLCRMVLTLHAPWCADEGLVLALVKLLENGNTSCRVAVWDCMSSCGVSVSKKLVHTSFDVLLRSQDESLLNQGWTSLVAKMRPERSVLEKLLNASFGWPSTLATAVSVLTSMRLQVAELPALIRAVSMCFASDDWTCVWRGTQWLGANLGIHPEQSQLLDLALGHWAKPVRAEARQILNLTDADIDDDTQLNAQMQLLGLASAHPQECCDN